MKRTRFAVTLACSLCLGSFWSPAAPAQSPSDTNAQTLLALHNAERAKSHKPPLRLNAKLSTAAQKYADLLAKTGKFSHTVGGKLAGRINPTGYRWSLVGENLAKGFASPQGAVKGWMHSPGHRANVLGHFKDVGFGVAKSKGGTVWVAEFGNPR